MVTLPQYSHQSARIAGFDGNYAIIFLLLAFSGYFLSFYFGNAYFFFLVVMILPVSKLLKSKPRGYVGSLSYHVSLSHYIGYPLATQRSFNE
jgi:hypothetical protein